MNICLFDLLIVAIKLLHAERLDNYETVDIMVLCLIHSHQDRTILFEGIKALWTLIITLFQVNGSKPSISHPIFRWPTASLIKDSTSAFQSNWSKRILNQYLTIQSYQSCLVPPGSLTIAVTLHFFFLQSWADIMAITLYTTTALWLSHKQSASITLSRTIRNFILVFPNHSPKKC